MQVKPFIFIDDLQIDKEEPIENLAIYCGEGTAPEGFKAISISLDGKINSSLNWKEAIVRAKSAIAKGLSLFWELDLGLFHQLNFNLEDQTQFASLCFSINHFSDVIWKEFSEQTIGISFYKGPFEFFTIRDRINSIDFHEWMKQFGKKDDLASREHFYSFFCRDVAIDYLNALAKQLPGTLPPCVFLEVSGPDLFYMSQMLFKESFQRINRAISFEPSLLSQLSSNRFGYLSSKKVTSIENEDIFLAICLPLEKKEILFNRRIKETYQQLTAQGKRCRLIPENLLMHECEGIETLFVDFNSISSKGDRLIKGFIASGGKVESI